MLVNPNYSVSFGRAFSTEERKKADELRKKALKLLDTDKIIAIVPEASLPSMADKNIGIGQLSAQSNKKFYDFISTYTGANSIKVLPHGEIRPDKKNCYCNYKASSLTLGTHTINLEDLKERGYKIPNDILNPVYEGAKKDCESSMANFENVIGKNTPHSKAIFEAYKSLSSANPSEKINFEKFKEVNKDRVEKRALFECLEEEYGTIDYQKWTNEVDKNLFNEDFVSKEARETRINELKSKYAEKIDFAFFKQYLAEENLKKGKELLHEKGMTLTGDCQIGFSKDEMWAYPKAFEKAYLCSEEWGIHALNYADITKEGTESNKLLKLKIEQYAKNYDNIRFDVGWAYVDPILYAKDEETKKLLEGRYVYDSTVSGYRVKEPLGDSVLKIIEDTVKDVKGKDYRKENLLYEIEAWTIHFTPFDWENKTLKAPFENRTIIHSTAYMRNDYANIDVIENQMKISRDNYVIMAGNHDHLNLESLARGKDSDKIVAGGVESVLNQQYEPLARALNLNEERLKKSPEEFVKAKFAYNFLGRNIKMFFMDIWGKSEQFDSQENNTTRNFRNRISSNYEKEYHSAIQKQSGLNIMDALAKAMKGKGLDKTNPDVYEDLQKYSKILYKKGALTEEEANKYVKRVKLIKFISIPAVILAAILGVCYIKQKKELGK